MSKDDFNRSYPLRTVCEVTREINRMLVENMDRIGTELYEALFALLLEQMRYQKKMDAKLRQYRQGYETEMYRRNENYKEPQP